MKLRWVELEADDTTSAPFVAIYTYGEATYFKLQIFQDGEWRDIPIEYLSLNEEKE